MGGFRTDRALVQGLWDAGVTPTPASGAGGGDGGPGCDGNGCKLYIRAKKQQRAIIVVTKAQTPEVEPIAVCGTIWRG